MLQDGTRFTASSSFFGLRKESFAFAAVLVLLAVSTRAATGEDNAAGASAFKTKCVACHGPDGSGNTPVGKSLKVADLRTPEIQKKSDAELADFISTGKGNMPAFKSSTPPEELQAIVKYVRSLAVKKDAPPKKKAAQ